MESLAMNHPFGVGNKRMAFFVTDTFLRINGWQLDCDNDEAHAFFMSLFDRGCFNFGNLWTWIERHIPALPE